MKVNAINQSNSVYSLRNVKISTKRLKNVTDTNNQTSNYYMITFKGNPQKRPEQIVAYSTESNYLGGIYKAGGLGDVGEALPEAIGEYGKNFGGKVIDVRTYLPYYSFDNAEGQIYVARKGSSEKVAKGIALTRQDDFFTVNSDYRLQDGESFALITESKDGNKVDKFFFLKDANLSGNVERVASDSLEMETVPYRVFEVDTKGARKDRMYMIHTPEQAKGKSSYGVYRNHARQAINGSSAYGGASSAYGGNKNVQTKATEFLFSGKEEGNMYYTEQIRALEDGLKKMDVAEHGNFNPQNWILHDRFPYVAMTDAAQYAAKGDEYYKGIRFVPIFHNTGRGYQGCIGNPLDFFRIIATKDDLEALKANSNYAKINEISKKITENRATKEECTQLYNFFKPYFEKFVDSEGVFNMTMIPISYTKENPANSVPGNVSKFFGKETRDFATEDIAKGLTRSLKEIEPYTIDIVNGTKPANMAINKQDGFFGTGSLNETFKNENNARKYATYSEKDAPAKILSAKAKNKENLINIIAEATEKQGVDKDSIAKVFFNNKKITDIRGKDANLSLSLGGLSKYKEGDILLTSWGRPDAQKGLPTTIKAFRMYLEDETIPLETRLHTKLLLGAGGGNDAFRGDNQEWLVIQEEMTKIANISAGGEAGKFKGNACYINGLFPNRIANCADVGVFTSRYEPCGITPFECYGAGTPVISIKTGGAPDFVKPGTTGFLTDDPYMLSRKVLGLSEGVTEKELDVARMEHSAKQIATKIKEYTGTIQNGTFEEKQLKYIENTLKEQIEWHNNNSYNNGKAALDLYLHDRCNTQNNDVPTELKSTLRGKFNDDAFIKQGSKDKVNTSFWKSKGGKWTIAGLAALAVAGGVLAILKGKGNKVTKPALPAEDLTKTVAETEKVAEKLAEEVVGENLSAVV